MGKKSAYPDGKPDAAFSLSFDSQASAESITGIEIQAIEGRAATWSTNAKLPDSGFIGVADASRPSVVINASGEPISIVPSEKTGLLLYVTDDGGFSQKQRKYEIKVTHADGSAWKTVVDRGARVGDEASRERRGAYPVRMSCILKGISNYDAVGSGKTLKGDDAADGLFVLTVEAASKEITAIQVANIDETRSVWDTIASSGNGALGVALVSAPVRLLNHRDGGVRIQVKERVDLNLYVADNGSIVKGEARFRAGVTFADGEVSWCPVTRIMQASSPGPESPKGGPVQVNFMGSWLGYVSTDAVGPYPEMKPDSKADSVFGMDIEITPSGEIIGVEVQQQGGASHRWATAGSSPGAWGLGVAYQSAARALLNKQDGSVRIPIDKREQFYLYAADPGDMATSSQSFRMVVHLSDGASYQQLVHRPLAPQSGPAPTASGPPRATGLITCEFRGFMVDLVNSSTRPGKDSFPDGTFIMRLKADDKKLGKVVIKGPDGAIRWSSHPKSPEMFLGISLYPRIYDLVNPKGGELGIPISGRKTLYLYAADNGLLSDPNSKLTVEASFSDNTSLSSAVIK